MCVAVPALVKSIEGTLAKVEIGGISREVSLRLTPEARWGITSSSTPAMRSTSSTNRRARRRCGYLRRSQGQLRGSVEVYF